MRLPNGFGSVYKLSGNRRRPWAARITVGWTFDEENQKSNPIYQFVGFYETRKEALTALTEYNKGPYDLHHDTITFEEVYEKWSAIHFPKISRANAAGYRAAFTTCTKLHRMRFADIKLEHMQRVIDDSGKNTPTLRKLRNLLSLMFDYAIVHEIIAGDRKALIRYLDINKAGNPRAYDRKPFTKKAIKTLWAAEPGNEYVSVVLILIYTGLRIGELLNLEIEDVHLEERWFFVRASKTEAGVREVPIAEKIVPFFERWLRKSSTHLICTPEGMPFTYRNYYDSYFIAVLDEIGLSGYTPHCARHTCVSLLTEAGVDERTIRKIVGHKGQGVTETVYTHLDLPVKLEAINRI